jgi:hypothetical protein
MRINWPVPSGATTAAQRTTLDIDLFLRRCAVHVIDSSQIGRRTFKLYEPTNVMQQAAEVSLAELGKFVLRHPAILSVDTHNLRICCEAAGAKLEK